MAIVTLDQLREQLNFTADMGSVDDALLSLKLDAAQDHLERYLGFKIEDTYGGLDQPEIPPALREAVCQLAAFWYEVREAAGEGARVIPFGVTEIADGYREWTF